MFQDGSMQTIVLISFLTSISHLVETPTASLVRFPIKLSPDIPTATFDREQYFFLNHSKCMDSTDIVWQFGLLLAPFCSPFASCLIHINLSAETLSTLFVTVDPSLPDKCKHPLCQTLHPSKPQRCRPNRHFETGLNRFPFNNFKYFSLSFQSSFLLSFTLLVRYRFLVHI